MDQRFSALSARQNLSSTEAQDLQQKGFVVVPGPVPEEMCSELSLAYDQAVLQAHAEDVKAGRTTIRVNGFADRGTAFDTIYLHDPLLHACCVVLKEPFHLSTMLARTLRPRAPAQPLHIDFPDDARGWPMVGFILMVDEFRPENGATCFVPGTHGAETAGENPEIVPACGPAGSMILYNGSVWHGHGANRTGEPRRSIQGAYIRRSEPPAERWPGRISAETLDRLSPLAKCLLSL